MWPILMLSLALNVVMPATQNVVAYVDETHILALVDQTRSEHGLGTLASDPSLVRAARRHALEMARAGSVYHTRVLHNAVRGWPALGENVASAATGAEAFRYFMDSPRHKALILDRSFTHAGVGVVIVDGTRYVDIFFGGPAS